MASSSDHEHKTVQLFDSSIVEIEECLNKLVVQNGEGVKGAVVLVDQGKIKLASAFPRSEKLVYAHVGFSSPCGINKYYEFEEEDDEPGKGDEGDDLKKQVSEDEDDAKSKTDLMIKEMIDGCKWSNLTKSAIQVIKSRVSTVPSDQFEELVEVVNLIKKKTEDED